MPYTTQGFMTAAIAEVQVHVAPDLDLCDCCESDAGGTFDPADPDAPCADCGHEYDSHA